jgi:hypothetical protein
VTGRGDPWQRGERAAAFREAETMAAELGVDVVPHPLMRHRYEALFPGGVLVGTGPEVCAETRRVLMREWVAVLGHQDGPA